MLPSAFLTGAGLLLLAVPAAASAPQAWHLPLAGLIPSSDPSTPTTQHHRFQSTGKGSNVVVLATESQVLAGVQPQDGSLPVLAWTTPSASDLHAIDVRTGKLLWNRDGLRDDCEGKKAEVFVEQRGDEAMENAIVMSGSGEEALSTFNGRYLALFAIADKSVDLTTFDLSPVLDSTSASLAVRSPPSSLSEVLAISLPSSSSFALIWPSSGSLAGVVTSGNDKLVALDAPRLPVKVDRLLDVGLKDKGVFLAMQEGGGKTAVIVALTEDGKLVSCGTFGVSNTGPSLASYTDRNGGLHISNLDFSRVLGFASLQIWSQTSDDPHGLISAHSFPLTKDEFSGMRGYALQVLPLPSRSTNPEDEASKLAPALSRVALVTSSGALQLWEGDNKKWTREDGIASAEVGPVDVREALGFLDPPSDLPTYLLASSLTRTIYAVSPTVNETFSIEWAATAPSSLFSSESGFKWLTIDGLREGKEGEPVVEAEGVINGVAQSFWVQLNSGKQVGKKALKEVDQLTSAVPAAYALSLSTPSPRTLQAHFSGSPSTAVPSWTFSLPPSYSILSVQAQVPPSGQPGPTHHSASLVAVLSSDSESFSPHTLSLLNAATGALVHQLQEPARAGAEAQAPQVMWDVSLPGWKVITAAYISQGKGAGETRVRVYKLKPGRKASDPLHVSAMELSLPGRLTPVGLSLTTLRLAAPCLLVTDRLNRLFAYPVRYLESLALGRPPVPGLPWQLSATRELLPGNGGRLLTGLPFHPSPSRLASSHPALRESESLVFSLSGGGSDLFAAVFSPSRSFDFLGEGFDRVQLGVVLAVLAVGWVGTRSWAASHRTKQFWSE
ncbi:hypothetical protein JCM11251_001786 [Rhodosporidiobolus azoricus]